jgi:hypothetical protein
MGAPLYPDATRLLVTDDASGSNGARLRLLKLELQTLGRDRPRDRRAPLPTGH